MKKIILLIILVIPTVLYLMLTKGKHNFLYLPYVIQLEEGRTLDRSGERFDENQRISLKKSFSSFGGAPCEGNTVRIFLAIENESVDSTLLASMNMLRRQLMERMKKMENWQLVLLWKSQRAEELQKELEQRLAMPWIKTCDAFLSKSQFEHTISSLEQQGVLNTEIPLALQAFMVDKYGFWRSGYDKKEQPIFTYVLRREATTKLLMEDAKHLLAEDFRALKNKTE